MQYFEIHVCVQGKSKLKFWHPQISFEDGRNSQVSLLLVNKYLIFPCLHFKYLYHSLLERVKDI